MDIVSIVTKPYKLRALATAVTMTVRDETQVGYHGCYRYSIAIYPQDIDTLRAIECIPLSFSLSKEGTPIEVRHVLDFIYDHCYRTLGIKVYRSTTEIYNDPYTLIIYPMVDGEYIYVTPKERAVLYFNPDPFVGYGLVSSDPLIERALEEQFSENSGSLATHTIGGVTVYSLDDVNLYMDQDSLRDKLDDINSSLALLRRYSGTLSTSDGTDEGKEALIEEIIDVWDTDMGCESGKWLSNTITSILLDDVPIYRVVTDWSNLKVDGRTIFKIQYIAYIAFTRTVSQNVHLSPFVNKVRVLSDLTVSIPCFSLQDVSVFTAALQLLVGTLDSINVIRMYDGEDAAIVRDRLQEWNPDSTSLVLGDNVVVTNSHRFSDDTLFEGLGARSSSESLPSATVLGRVTGLEPMPLVPVPPAVITTDNSGSILTVDGSASYIIEIDTPTVVDTSTVIGTPGVSGDDRVATLHSLAQDMGNKGLFTTRWGKYLFDKYHKVSVIYTKKPLHFSSIEEAIDVLQKFSP